MNYMVGHDRDYGVDIEVLDESRIDNVDILLDCEFSGKI